MRKAGLWVAVAGAAMVVAACSSSDDAAGSAETAFVTKYCAALRSCCPAGSPGEPAPGTACPKYYELFEGSTGYDAAKADGCLAEIEARKSDADFCSRAPARAPSCAKVFAKNTGTKAQGEACSGRPECAASNEGVVECVDSVCRLSTTATGGGTPLYVCLAK